VYQSAYFSSIYRQCFISMGSQAHIYMDIRYGCMSTRIQVLALVRHDAVDLIPDTTFKP